MVDSASGRQNLVVAHFKDGTLLKGITHDFAPARGSFHLASESPDDEGENREVKISDLKAVFFVKSLEGNPDYHEKKKFEETDTSSLRGLKISAEFLDGEIINGVSLGYSKEKPGFFIIPIDKEGNNERIYVVADACRDVKIGSAALK